MSHTTTHSPTDGSLPHNEVPIQFDNVEQHHTAVAFGMWIFLATEVLFFGGMVVAYIVYRIQYPDAFEECSKHVNLWIGAGMTVILLAGSLLVAMSDHELEEHEEEADAEERDRSNTKLRNLLFRRLMLTAFFGVAFLCCEFYEYGMLFHERLVPGSNFHNGMFSQLEFGGRSAQIFFSLFFCMTGLHMLHMIIGVGLVLGVAVAIKRSSRPKRMENPLKVIGLYWHFVDIVWLFLYPLFYLVR